MIRGEGSTFYAAVDGKTFSVLFAPGNIMLHGEPGHQFFKNPENLTPLQVASWDRAEIEKRATMHKDTHTDKAAFAAEVVRFHQAGKLSSEQADILLMFIQDCKCAPEVVRLKVAKLGMAWLAMMPEFRFERYQPGFYETVEAFEGFLRELPNHLGRTDDKPVSGQHITDSGQGAQVPGEDQR